MKRFRTENRTTFVAMECVFSSAGYNNYI